MASTKIIVIRNNVYHAFKYITDPNKTELAYISNKAKIGNYISAYSCSQKNAYVQMSQTKRRFGKEDAKITGYHIIQSFNKGEATPELAHKIGCELAERSLANRYEVVVSTHLNKEHLHNHILFNSVSFIDGKMYRNNLKDYYKDIRSVSDELCQKYSLSIISPQGKGKHYAQWQAEKEGRQTWRSVLQEYVDIAINASVTDKQFYYNLKKLGLEIKYGKHIAIRPQGKERFVRLRSLGQEYTQERIMERILCQTKVETIKTPTPPIAKQIRIQSSFFTLKKVTWKGLRALYFYYLCKLQQAQKSPNSISHKALFLLREELRNLDKISAHARFLFTNKYDTQSQINTHIQKTNAQIEELCKERKIAVSQIIDTNYLQETEHIATLSHVARRHLKSKSYKMYKAKGTAQYTKKIAELRKEVRLCNEILKRSEMLQEKRKQMNSEVKKIEYTRRSCRTGGEYGNKANR